MSYVEALEDRTLLTVNLNAGDLAVVGYNSDTNDFVVMTLADIPGNSTIFLTDQGWEGSALRTASGLETVTTWTTGAGTIQAGTLIRISRDEPTFMGSAFGTLSGAGSLDISSGDQILIYQTADTNPASAPTFITAFNGNNEAAFGGTDVNGDGWQDAGGTTGNPNSQLPTGLVANVTAYGIAGQIAGGEVDNFVYNGPATAADRATWHARIGNPANWIGTDGGIGSGGYDFGDATPDGSIPTGNTLPVVAPPDTTVTLSGGVLTISDVNGANSNDNLAISHSGGIYTITDTGGLLLDASSIAGSTGNSTATVTIPDTGVNSIVFNTLGGDDTVTVNSVQAALSGNFTIMGGTGVDSAIVNGDIATTGTGAVNITVSRNIVLGSGSSITTVDGGITLDANSTGMTTGNFVGLEANNATIQTTGTGNISLSGRGANNGNANFAQFGVYLHAGTSVSSTATGMNAGTITINGTGGDGSFNNFGVYLVGSTTGVTSVDGDIAITGNGGNGTGDANYGVAISGIESVSSTGMGADAATITINGTGGDGSSVNYGVLLAGSTTDVTSVDGDIAITGNGGNGTSSHNYGVSIQGIESISSTGMGADAATITINGTGGDGSSSNFGVVLNGGTTDVTSVDGDIAITGNGGNGTSNANHGVYLISSSVQVTTGNLSVIGTAAAGNSHGVWLHNLSGGQLLSVGSGEVSVIATGNGTSADIAAGGNSIIGGPSATGNITVDANTVDLSGSTSVSSTGNLVIQPRTAGTTIGLGGGAGTLNLTDTELGFLADGFNSITIGDTTSGTGTVDITTATFLDPVTIAGGTINDGAGADINAGTNAVTLDGNVAPGQSPGVLTVTGNYAFATGSTFEAEIMGAAPGTQHDQIAVTGTVNLNNTTLNIDDTGFTAVGNESFILINNDGVDAVTGTFNGLGEGAAVAVGGKSYTITYVGGDGNDVVLVGDTTAPVVNSITRLDGNPTNNANVNFAVIFSEPVTGVGIADFVLDQTGLTGAAITGVTGSGAVYTVSVNTGTGDGTLSIDFDADSEGGVADAAGNVSTADFTTGEVYDIDKTRPTVVSIVRTDPNPTNSVTVDFTVTFSEAVFAVDIGDFVIDQAGLTGATVSSVSGTGDTYTVAVSTGSGDGTLSIDFDSDASGGVRDLANNFTNTDFTTGQAYNVDKTNPFLSIARQTPMNEFTNADQVTFRVTFNEEVQNVNAADFTLVGTAAGDGSIGTVVMVGGDASIYDVTVLGLTNSNGTIGLGLSASQNIIDLVGNLANPLPASGELYTIDNTAPTVMVDIVDASLSDVDRTSVVTFEFSENVVGFDVSDLMVTNGTIADFMMVDGDSYTAVFTAADNFLGTGSVAVNAGGYTDVATNVGTGGSDNVSIDTFTPASIVGRANDGGIWTATTNGVNGFTTEFHTTWNPSISWTDTLLADVNGDNLDDIVSRDSNTGEIYVNLANGSSFDAQQVWGTWSTAIVWEHVQAGDFNGDGMMDIIGQRNNAWWVATSNGSSFTTQYWGTFANRDWQDVYVADFNGDGMDDVVGRDVGNWWVGISNGSSFTNQFWGSRDFELDWDDTNIADVNGDGMMDIVNRTSGNWWVSLSTGTSFTQQRWGYWRFDIDWINVNVADVNGDGLMDIVGRDKGNWWLALSDGTKFSTEFWGTWSHTVTWDDVSIGDYNGDGMDDIAGRTGGNWWVQSSTGTNFNLALWGAWSTSTDWEDVLVGVFS